MDDPNHDSVWVLFGTQRSGPGTGFSRARFDLRTGLLTPPALVQVADDPSYFVVDASGRCLYACHSGTPGGVGAYRLDHDSGRPRLLNAHISRGRGPSHLSLDRSGRFVLAANYGGGYVEVLAIAADGSLGPQTACIQHAGRGPDPERQTQPHPHCVRVTPDNRLALVADLGLDRMMVYRFDATTGALAPHDPGSTSVAPASGPRHFVWHPNGRWIYLVEEISSSVTVFSWDAGGGTLQELQTVRALPQEYAAANTSAEILVHPRGHALYVSNRGHESVARFTVDASTGRLGLAQHVPSGGHTPRYMTIDPTGAWLLVTNHDSDAVTVFGIASSDGRLTPQGEPVRVRRPFGVAFVAAGASGL